MRQLLLLRHAHAEDVAPGGTDFVRPLSPRGRAEALEAARCILVAGLQCDTLLVSPAARTRQTADIVTGELGYTPRARFPEDLYLADAATLLRELASAGASASSVLLVAHNPGLSELARQLTDGEPLELRTSGLCQLRFEALADWGGLGSISADRYRMLR